MRRTVLRWVVAFAVLSCTCITAAQQVTSNSVIVPHLIRFGGTLKNANGQPLRGTAGITFALYKDQDGGAALWLETQNVQLDSAGHYSVLLGATKEEGIPMDLFTSGQAQWLGIHVQGQPEQPRIWMVSVPYALKAADADTLGGLPASAFVRAAAPVASDTASGPAAQQASSSLVSSTPCTLSSDGTATAGQIPKFSGPCGATASQLFDNATNVGIGTKTPAAKLDVAGSATVRAAR